ncbi:hypothetical protein GE09DRAFT_286992 [Coniochaeta sp. 2T2.1]|nr:hypothetical protein GE09DRAFT_286992 [Coniochaeta sp. 2T2.1]
MDLQQSQNGSPRNQESQDDGSRSGSQLEKTYLQAKQPKRLPMEIIGMIFVEYLSKPSIHFASVAIRATPGRHHKISMVLSPWSDGPIESGYTLSRTLNKTCRFSRNTVDRAIATPALIQYDKGSVIIDGSMDMVCFVPRKFWSRQVDSGFNPLVRRVQSSDMPEQKMWLRDIHHTGFLVTQDAWHRVLANWFILDMAIDRESYAAADGRLHNLWTLFPWAYRERKSLARTWDFYMVLSEVTVEDWNTYYSKFATVFHDSTGSYVEAVEQPVHSDTIRQLWRAPQEKTSDAMLTLLENARVRMFPYLHRHPNINPDMEFESRVDAQLDPAIRVALLLGMAWEMFMRGKPRWHVLARKPILPGKSTSDECTEPPPQIKDSSAGKHHDALRSDSPESEFLQHAIENIMTSSKHHYQLDAYRARIKKRQQARLEGDSSDASDSDVPHDLDASVWDYLQAAGGDED